MNFKTLWEIGTYVSLFSSNCIHKALGYFALIFWRPPKVSESRRSEDDEASREKKVEPKNPLARLPIRIIHYWFLLRSVTEETSKIGPITMAKRAASLAEGVRVFRDKLLRVAVDFDERISSEINVSKSRHLFGSICSVDADYGYQENTKTDFFVLICRDQFFRISLNSRKDVAELAKIMAGIDGYTKNAHALPDYGLGKMTLGNMSAYVETKNHLVVKNRKEIETIEKALFIMILEPDHFPATLNEASTRLRGWNYSSRWYSAQTQIVVFGNGGAGMIFSHLNLEGHVAAKFASEVQMESDRVLGRMEVPETNQKGELDQNVEHLKFDLDENGKDALNRSQIPESHPLLLLDEGHAQTWFVDNFGQDEIKRRGYSPDALFNIATQLAFFLDRKRYQPVYECVLDSSVDSTLFILPINTREALEFVQKAVKPSANTNHLECLLRNAASAHLKVIESIQTHSHFMFRSKPFPMMIDAKKNFDSGSIFLSLLPGTYKKLHWLLGREHIETSSGGGFPGIEAFGHCAISVRSAKVKYVFQSDRLVVDMLLGPGLYQGRARELRFCFDQSFRILHSILSVK